MLTKEQIKLLETELDPAQIASREGSHNQILDYIEAYNIINNANRIFGFGNWGTEIVKTELINTREYKSNKGWDMIEVTVMAQVRVTVKDCISVVDVGVCSNDAASFSAAYEIAMKGAVSDGMKRALRTFGNQFGNSLYDKSTHGGSSTKGSLYGLVSGFAENPVKSGEVCSICNKEISLAEAGYSEKRFGSKLCRTCQKSAKPI